MVYEQFFERELWQVKTVLENQNWHQNLLMRIGANAMDQAVGFSHYAKGFGSVLNIIGEAADGDRDTGGDTGRDAGKDTGGDTGKDANGDIGKDADGDIGKDAGEDTSKNTGTNTAKKQNASKQDWLIHYLHEDFISEIGVKPLERLMRNQAHLAWEEIDRAKDKAMICEILPFLAYYETRWNERKGYGELAALAKVTANNAGGAAAEHSQISSGSLMASMAQCYGEMTEEAYDQREVFADLLRQYAKAFREQWNPQAMDCSLDCLKAAYALLKGIRLGVLQHESYKDIATVMLTFMESNGFVCEIVCERGRVRLKEEENSDEKAMYCMMAYGEYIMLGKERPYYGISHYI